MDRLSVLSYHRCVDTQPPTRLLARSLAIDGMWGGGEAERRCLRATRTIEVLILEAFQVPRRE